jgi:hypothetical protein
VLVPVPDGVQIVHLEYSKSNFFSFRKEKKIELVKQIKLEIAAAVEGTHFY